MPTYQKAYRLGELRAFDGWPESVSGEDGDIVFLDEQLCVRASCVDSDSVIFDGNAVGWVAFCEETLCFAVPDWEKEAADVRRRVAEGAAGSDST